MNTVIRSGLSFVKLSTNVSNSFKHGMQNDVRQLFSRNLWNTSLRGNQKYMLCGSNITLNNYHFRNGHTKSKHLYFKSIKIL